MRVNLLKGLLERTKQNKTHVFKLTKEAAKTAAEKEFMKFFYKLPGIEYRFGAVKGIIRRTNLVNYIQRFSRNF